MRIAIIASVGMLTFGNMLIADDRSTGSSHQPPGSKPLTRQQQQQRVDRLIAELDAVDLSVRSVAQKELSGMGPVILPLLPTVESIASPAVREDLSRLRQYLELQKSRQAVEPSILELPATTTVGAAFQLLSSRTGNLISTAGLSKEELSRSLQFTGQEITFWEAVQRIEAQTGLAPAAIEDLTLHFVKQNPEEPESIHVSNVGPFRVSVFQAELRPLIGDQRQRILRCELGLLAEPRLTPLYLKYESGDFKALSEITSAEITGSEDETRVRKEFVPYSPAARNERPWVGKPEGVRFRIDFVVPTGELPEMFDLQGQVSIHTATEVERIEIEQALVDRNASTRWAGIQVSVDKVFHRENNTADADNPTHDEQVYLCIAYDKGGPEFESHRTWMFYNAVYLQNKKGDRVLHQPGFKTSLQSDGSVVLGYDFVGLTEPNANYKLVYEAPTLLLTLPVELKLTDIPITSARP